MSEADKKKQKLAQAKLEQMLGQGVSVSFELFSQTLYENPRTALSGVDCSLLNIRVCATLP